MKKTGIILAVAFAAAVAFGAAPELVKVKASKKTADSHKNTAAVGGHRSVERSSKDIFYEFELSTMAPSVAPNVNVKWVVVTLNMMGRPRVGTKGEKMITLTGNKPVVIETDDLTLESKDVHISKAHRGTNNSSEEKIIGYGVRVYDDQGSMISETISSENARKDITEAFGGEMGDAKVGADRKEKKRNK